ncbi:hypothetical protein [Tenggerimyces flavus]|uniref:Uncharacterized protein n=1 Tax=Tenggerimyces flavus TaxID=1708749 RepID=A0ABV7Y752_9ACTN|nr:hypothetical protein [Tenggerimyces flavus]MBM7785030.1 myosin heavy subunit [Tenggerimyces flavus]
MNDLQGYYRELTARLKALADSEPVRKVEEARQKALGELLERIQSSDLRERVEEAFQQQQRSLVDFAHAVQGVLSAQQQAMAELIAQVERNISDRLPGRGLQDEDELAPFPPPPAAVSAAPEPAAAPVAKKAAAKKSSAKKAAAKKAPAAKKTAAKKTAAKKTATKAVDGSEPAAKKAVAKKSTVKKAAAKKTAAKKTAAKKASPNGSAQS